jgi:hypothetical protein
VAQKTFFKENFVLIVGLALPVLLVIGFMVASNLPQRLSDPPKYDLVFATTEYPPNANNIPIGVRLVVKDGVLKAQYVRTNVPPNTATYNGWKKLYVYEAGSRKVRELTFGFPPDMNEIEGSREEAVESTKSMKLDTTLQSPDGYQLSYEGHSHSGLLNDFFWGGGGYGSEPLLRKGSSTVKLATGDGRTYFSYSGLEFVGWVTGRN